MTYWQEDEAPHEEYVVPSDVVDVSYRIRCRELPVDHVHALCSELHDALPWLPVENQAGVHPIHGAASGNGWQRPEEPDALLHLSRRTRLRLRVPAHRVTDAQALAGVTLQVAGRALEVGESTVRPLSTASTLFARYVASEHVDDEQRFLAEAAAQLEAMQVPSTRIMAGRRHALQSPHGTVAARSLMVAGLSPAQSVQLQQRGLGSGRAFCCGLFIAHRGIDPVGDAA